MLIRSQRKRSIINVERTESIGIDKDNDIKAYVGDGWYLLGEYSTEEKALKVLDIIHAKVILQCRVFEMPQDSEV